MKTKRKIAARTMMTWARNRKCRELRGEKNRPPSPALREFMRTHKTEIDAMLAR